MNSGYSFLRVTNKNIWKCLDIILTLTAFNTEIDIVTGNRKRQGFITKCINTGKTVPLYELVSIACTFRNETSYGKVENTQSIYFLLNEHIKQQLTWGGKA
jgi:hypothetical protein